MAARKRKAGESFTAYRENLKQEEKQTKRILSGVVITCFRNPKVTRRYAADIARTFPRIGIV